MNTDRIIISIGRQVGSGGKEIGKTLAALFGIDFYDQALINLVAQESGLCPDFLKQTDEKPSNALTYALCTTGINFVDTGLNEHTLFGIQSDVIRRLASEKSCVFIGRTADYILRDFENCINVYIHAPIEIRVQKIMKEHSLSEHKALKMITKIENERANYYNHYTHKTWGMASSYHLSVDSSIHGIEGSAEVIKYFIKQKNKNK